MKKLIAFIALGGLILSSCEKNSIQISIDSIQNQENSTYVFTLNASLDEVFTKTAYAGDKTFSWSEGDQISVLFNDGEGNNKYYTLTAATGGSALTTFSGTIDTGWSLGASDTGKKWALYPASANHSYDTSKQFPVFFIPQDTDFTAPGAHYSANIPMVASLPSDDETNSYTFAPATTTFKITFTDVDASKVKLIVTNQTTRILSGNIAVKLDGSRNYLSYSSSDSSGSTTITFTENATSKTAVFYIPFRGYNGEFQPVLTLVNMDDGANKDNIILSKTAKASAFSNGGEGYSWSRIVVVPSMSAPGVGSPYLFASKFGIDWYSASLPSGTGSDSGEDYQGIRKVKATADAQYIYIYYEIAKSKLLLNEEYKYANTVKPFFGKDLDDEDGSWLWTPKRKVDDRWGTWLLRYGSPYNGSSSSKNEFWGDYLYGEYRHARSDKDYLQITGAAYVGVVSYYGKWNNGTADQTTHSKYMFAPKTSEGFMVVDMPAYPTE